jgi:hypothetical protein
MPGVAFPPVGPLGLSSPPSPVLCSAKTATLSVSRRFTCRSRPDTLPASVRSWYPPRARGLVEAPRPRQGLWSPGPHSGNVTRRQVALPSSRVTPVKTCPALRPRWCPEHSPSRLQDCCLPAGKNRRLSPLYSLEGYPCVHHDILFGAPSRGLSSRVPSSFVRPLLGVHVECASGLLARLWPDGT